MTNSKAVVLFSGGLDSTTCLALAQHQHNEVYTLSFDYGQKHRFEVKRAKAIAEQRHVKTHHLITIPTHIFQHSALTDTGTDIPDYRSDDTIPATYVPARNVLFLSYGLAYAKSIGATCLYIGVSAVDYSGYPDCRPAFIEAFSHMASIATDTGHDDKLTICTPLLHLSKAKTIALGIEHGVNYADTISCYRSNAQGEACGRCDSCVLRQQGFAAAGIPDPTRYASTQSA